MADEHQGPAPAEADATAERVAQALLDDLVGAVAAAERVAGVTPVGVRAVEPAAGRRLYLCAFEGPRFLCLSADLTPEPRSAAVREAATASLLWEHLEALVDAEGLRALVRAIGRLLAIGGEPPAVTAHLGRVAEHALELAAWRDRPERVLASLPAADQGAAIQERVLDAYARYLIASEPLVASQDTLPEAMVQSLRELESCAVRAGAGERLTDRLAAVMPECDESAGQVLEAHMTRLTD